MSEIQYFQKRFDFVLFSFLCETSGSWHAGSRRDLCVSDSMLHRTMLITNFSVISRDKQKCSNFTIYIMKCTDITNLLTLKSKHQILKVTVNTFLQLSQQWDVWNFFLSSMYYLHRKAKLLVHKLAYFKCIVNKLNSFAL